MEIESVLLTALTIAFGWCLNELSQFLRFKREDKRLINEALFFLIDLSFMLDQLRELVLAAKKQENLSSLSKRSFNSLLNDENLNSKSFKSNLKKTVKVISKFDPVLAQEMRVTVDGVNMFDNSFLGLKDPGNQMDEQFLLDMNDMAFELFSKKIQEFTRKLAFRKSKLTWLKIHISNFRERKNDNNLWANHFEELNNLASKS
jgi:hypothetical protein|tara:strand:- start:2769 stop:3377 length:609 start_codon:yes stop_codon:yes gene_type:complete